MTAVDEEDPKFVRIEIEGHNHEKWYHLRTKFIRAVHKTLDTVIDHENSSTLRDEAKKFTTELLHYGKAKLQRAGLENEELMAEVALLYVPSGDGGIVKIMCPSFALYGHKKRPAFGRSFQ